MKIHPLNAKGKYYIDIDTCTCSAACEYYAPNHIVIDESDYSAYFVKQPETPDEEEQCREAMNCCPVEAILDNGESKNQ
jgi:ferredoxin